LGFSTVTENVPAVDALPVAVSCVADTNVVANGAPAISTCAPLTNPLPCAVIVIAPAGVDEGVTLVSTGIGFIKVTAALLDAAESAALTARTVTEPELGTLPGAVYMPEELITPVAVLPPVTPFTCQLTVVFDDPVTIALKGCDAPGRRLAVLGETETATLEDGDDGEPEEFDGPLVAPVHPVRAANRKSTKRECRERISLFP
jgi:hypothetical protein